MELTNSTIVVSMYMEQHARRETKWISAFGVAVE
jgi:hypothetical protein